MKINLKKCLAVLSAVLLLSAMAGCSQGGYKIDYSDTPINVDTSDDAITNLTLSYTSGEDLTTQNPFRSIYGTDLDTFSNLYDGLVTCNEDNTTQPALAKSWESSDDCTTWTFHLRDDAYWVNYKGEKQDRVTADDFVTGLEWVLNFAKNEGLNLQISTEYIDGAEEYFKYTQSLSENKAKSLSFEKFQSMVGVEAPDENTVVYHCTRSCPYFLSLVSFIEFFPASAKHIADIGIDKFIVNAYYDAWYNGPYVMTEFIADNEHIFDANPYWYGNEDYTRFMSVTYKAVESASVALQLYKNNELDYVDLYVSQVRTILADEDSSYADLLAKAIPLPYMEQCLFNFQKKNEDGTEDEQWNRAAACEAFRLSWYYGMDFSNELKACDFITPYSCSIESMNASGLATLSDGTDYADLVESKLGITKKGENSIRRLDSEKFKEYKKQAMEELSAQGVSFPIQADYYVLSSDQASLDSALLLKSDIEESLGDDYVKLNIKSYSSSYLREVSYPQKCSFEMTGWGADYKDPSSVLKQYIYGDDNAYLLDKMNISNYTSAELSGEKNYLNSTVSEFKEFNALYEKADAIIDDYDARYEAFAESEAYLIKHGLSIPMLQSRGWSLTKVDLTSKCTAPFGSYTERLVNVKTNINGYDNSIWEETD